jgi:hypothetical protein
LVYQFAASHALAKRRLIIVLDDTLVLRRAIPRGAPAQNRALLENLKSMVPFTPENQAFVVHDEPLSIVLFATNRAVYRTVCTALERATAHIDAVVPFAAYSVTASPVQLDAPSLKLLGSNHQLRDHVNFLQIP